MPKFRVQAAPLTRDLRLIYLTSFVRSSAISALSVFYGLYLAELGLGEVLIGILISSGLLGMAAGSLVAAKIADRFGRRRSLIILSVLMAGSGIALALSSELSSLLAASFVGMVNGMGRDRGALQAIDQAVVTQAAPVQERTMAFARYTFFMDIGGAAGGLIAGIPQSLDAFRMALFLYAGTLALVTPFYSFLSKDVEAKRVETREILSPQTRKRVAVFSGLSMLDGLGGGFITRSLLTYWFVGRFHADPIWIGFLFAGSALVNSVAYFAAARLARKFGLVNTMVFTHIPSSILLMLVPLAGSFPVAVALFIVREFFAPMDVPTRQSYLAAVVEEHERSAAAGIVNIARNASWVAGPTLAGWAMTLSFSAPLYFAGILKIIYDLSLWKAFRGIIPPEER